MKHLHRGLGHPSYILIQMLHPYGCVIHFTEYITASSNGSRHEMRSRVEVPSTGRDEAFAPTPRLPVPHFGTNASSLRDLSPPNRRFHGRVAIARLSALGCRDEAFAPRSRPPVPQFGTNASYLRDVSIFNTLRATRKE